MNGWTKGGLIALGIYLTLQVIQFFFFLIITRDMVGSLAWLLGWSIFFVPVKLLIATIIFGIGALIGRFYFKETK